MYNIDFNSKVNVKMKIHVNLGDKKDNPTCCAFLAEMSCWASLNYSINSWQCFVLAIAGFLTFFYFVRGRGWVSHSDNDLGHFPFITKNLEIAVRMLIELDCVARLENLSV